METIAERICKCIDNAFANTSFFTGNKTRGNCGETLTLPVVYKENGKEKKYYLIAITISGRIEVMEGHDMLCKDWIDKILVNEFKENLVDSYKKHHEEPYSGNVIDMLEIIQKA